MSAAAGADSRRVIAFVNIAHSIDHMFVLIFPAAVLAMGGSFQRSYGELLALSVGSFIAFGAGSVPSGWLGDKWSRRNMMAVFFFGIGAATILVGLSTSVVMLAVSLTLIGLFASIYHPVGGALLASHTTRLGRDLGLNGVWGNLGIAFSALITAGVAQYLGWRFAFFIPGGLSILIGIAFVSLVPDERNAAKRSPVRAQPAVVRATAIRAFGVMAAITIFGGVVFSAATVSLPKLFNERLLGFVDSPVAVGALVAAVYVTGAVAQLIIGRLLDRHSLRSIFMPLALLQAPCLFIAASAGDWALLLAAAGLMFAVFGQVTINDALVVRFTTDEWRARAYSLRYLLSFGVSAATVPMVAFLHDHGGGFPVLFQVLAGCGLCVFLSTLFLPYSRSEPAPARPVPLADAAD
ncbi:MFS transporter [Ferrovibrio xuzhouensis]|uniref:MFS transporter n=1 Tax=Ferrovibrio xuzhouensis TaxID=1576914 RepID=A0ABV7VG62_9PROT